MSTTDKARPPAQWPRFSIRRMLVAAFWMALCFGAWMVILRTDPPVMSRSLVILVVYVATTAPLLAIGELLERKVSGILIVTSGWLLLLCLGVLMVG